MSTKPTSDIDIGLPNLPMTQDRKLYDELVLLYNAVRLLQGELSVAKSRIKSLEDYNTAHP